MYRPELISAPVDKGHLPYYSPAQDLWLMFCFGSQTIWTNVASGGRARLLTRPAFPGQQRGGKLKTKKLKCGSPFQRTLLGILQDRVSINTDA